MSIGEYLVNEQKNDKKIEKEIERIIITSRFPFLDTNECSSMSPCHANATCNNTEGSYICTCDAGFTGDGYTCDGIM